MIDAQNGAFQLQARTSPAQGDSTNATIFTAGTAKEENSSTVEVRVKKGGEGYIKVKIQRFGDREILANVLYFIDVFFIGPYCACHNCMNHTSHTP